MCERFIVDDKPGKFIADERVFKNNKCVFNKRLGFAYSVDEIVEVLNELGKSGDFLTDLIQTKIWYCQAKYEETQDSKWLTEEECLRTLRNEYYDKNSIIKYAEYLAQRIEV